MQSKLNSVTYVHSSTETTANCGLELNLLPLGYTSATLGYLPLPHYEFIMWFDFSPTSVNIKYKRYLSR